MYHNSHLQKRGVALLVIVFFVVVISSLFVLGLSSSVVREYVASRNLTSSTQSYYTSESGHEDVLYRLRTAKKVDATEVITLLGTYATTTTATSGNIKTVLSTGNAQQMVRKTLSTLSASSGASFNFGIQAGNGGFTFRNSSSVAGSVYADGPIVGDGSSSVSGSVIAAGPTGSVSGIVSGSSMYAHTITNSVVGKDAYYQIKTNTSVAGVSYPGSADQPTQPFPISEERISQWEEDAAAGGTYSGPCTISSPVTWSARKVTCSELVIKDKITLSGMVWVTGNVTFRNPSGAIAISPTLGDQSTGIIADNPTNRTTSSRIIIENSASFTGSGVPGSSAILISQNNSAESGGAVLAIELRNTATGDLLLYAPHGKVTLGNNTRLREVTGYRIELNNSARVIYDTGLASTLFVSGPGGTWLVHDWKESAQ